MLGPHIFGRGREYLQFTSDEVAENRCVFLNFCAGCDLKVMNMFFQKVPENQFTFREPATNHEPPSERFAQLDYFKALERWKKPIKDVTAMTCIFSDSDHYIVIADCCVRLQAKPKHVHRPKYRQPTREQIAAFNAVIAQYMQETTRRDIGLFLRVIQDADKQCCVFLRCHLSNAGFIFLNPLGTRSWGETRRMNKAIGPLLRS